LVYCSSANRKVFLQIFSYLPAYITYEEHIKIKLFRIILSTDLTVDKEFVRHHSKYITRHVYYVCRKQYNIRNTFDGTDLEGIYTYAIRCEDTVSHIFEVKICNYAISEENIFDSVVTIDINRIYIKICSILKYKIEENMCIMFDLLSMTILLVD